MTITIYFILYVITVSIFAWFVLCPPSQVAINWINKRIKKNLNIILKQETIRNDEDGLNKVVEAIESVLDGGIQKGYIRPLNQSISPS